MSDYERYQTLTQAGQELFSPGCPVSVLRYQLSLDLEQGQRLLQVRMLNHSDRTVMSVYLRIVCKDARGQEITTLELIPVTGLAVRTGRIFGDDKVLTLWPSGVTFVEIYPQRVVFTDATAWNEPARSDYISVPPPVAVRPGDELYPALAAAARTGGVHNDYYFKSLRGAFQCTCGVTNSGRSLRCVRCGAPRAWLEAHMDPESLRHPAPAPAPEPAAPAAAPAAPSAAPAAPAAPSVPPVVAPVVVPAAVREPDPLDLAQLLAPEPPAPPAAPVAPQPREEAKPEKKASGGRTAAIIAAVLVFLLGAAWCSYKYLMPFMRYQEGVSQQATAQYEQAIATFTELGEYKDAPQRILDCKGQIGLGLMRNEDYAAAYQALLGLPGYESYCADCLYSLGVLAYNAGDVETAWSYVEQLEQEYGGHEKLEPLKQRCNYSRGLTAFEDAGVAPDPDQAITLYYTALEYFAAAGDYQDSADRILRCRYQIADLTEQMGNLTGAADLFGELGDYEDAPERRLKCMYDYAESNISQPDQTTIEYLGELAREGYEDSAWLQQQATGQNEYAFHVSMSPVDDGAGIDLAWDLSLLYVHYDLDVGGELIHVLMRYTLPDGKTGQAFLNSDGTPTGTKPWTSLVPVTCQTAGEVRLEFTHADRPDTVLGELVFRYDPAAAPAPDPAANQAPDTGVQPADGSVTPAEPAGRAG